MVGCGDKVDPLQRVDSGTDETNGPVTYAVDIQPLLETHCLSCHSSQRQGSERSGAPINVDFDSYAGIVQWIDEASLRIQSGTMPLTGGIRQEDRALFQRWIDDGFPAE